MEVIVFTDLHLADKPPLGRLEGYKQEGLDMLAECVDIAHQRGATLVCGGDFTHLKAPTKNSLRLLGEVTDILKPFNEKMLVVPGNHDMNPRGTLEGQPLELLEKNGLVEILEYDNPYMFGKEGVIHARPYDVHRDADPTYYALTPLEHKGVGLIDTGALSLLVAHGSIIPDAEYRPYPTVRVCDIDTAGIDVLVAGHIHENLGQQPLHSKGGIFINVGALGRCSRTEANRTRTIQVVSVSGGGNLDIIDLKSARPSDSIFLEAESQEVESDQIAEFVACLSAGLQIEQVGDIQAHIEKMGVPPFMAEMTMKYLERAGL